MEEIGKSGEVGDRAYVALIGDVVDSRGLEHRSEFQSQLRDALERLERQLNGALVGRLVLLRGDEIQALFSRPEAAVEVVVQLAEDLFPVRMSYGLGYGSLSTELLSDVAQMDGPCFHHARSALEMAKRSGDWLVARGFNEPANRVVSALFRLMHVVRSRWTERQAQFVQAARSSQQKDVAARFGVSPSVVSESLKAASFTAVREGERATREALRQFGKNGELTLNSVTEPNRPLEPWR